MFTEFTLVPQKNKINIRTADINYWVKYSKGDTNTTPNGIKSVCTDDCFMVYWGPTHGADQAAYVLEDPAVKIKENAWSKTKKVTNDYTDCSGSGPKMRAQANEDLPKINSFNPEYTWDKDWLNKNMQPLNSWGVKCETVPAPKDFDDLVKLMAEMFI